MTVPARLHAAAQGRPDAVAMTVVDAASLTFANWDARSTMAARGLRELGVGRGDRVLLSCDAGGWLDYAVAYVATHKAGAVAVPVADALGDVHRRRIERVTAARAVVGPGHVPVAELEAAAAGGAGAAALGGGDVDTGGDDPAEILYTSGTTGVPKGVLASHANLLHTHVASRSGPKEERRVLHAVPPGTNAGQNLLILPLHPEPTVILTVASFDAAAFLAAVEALRPTELVLVPALALLLVRAAERADHDLTSVRVVRSMGAAIAPRSLQALAALFGEASTYNMYASTESWPARTRVRYDPSRPGSVGRPAGGSEVRVVDDIGIRCDPGEPGDVQMRLSDAPPRRYVDDEGATAEVFLPGGWVRTGDVGYIDADGYLYLVDRSSDIVVTGGLNVSTLEVEAALHEHPDVADVAVFGLEHPLLGEYVAAAVQARGDLAVGDLGAFAGERLGDQKAPKRFFVVDDFPRNAMGKVLKRELRARFTADREAARPADPPRTATEALIAQLWQTTLDLPEAVGRRDDFLSLGGTSLAATEIAARLRAALDVDARPRHLFEAATLADLATLLEAAPAVEPDARAPIRPVARVR